MKTSAAGIRKLAMSATTSLRRGVSARWAMAAVITLALTNNGMAAQMTQFPRTGPGSRPGEPCHEQVRPALEALAARLGVLNGEVQILTRTESNIPGAPLSAGMCDKLQQVNEASDSMVSFLVEEDKCFKDEGKPDRPVERSIQKMKEAKDQTVAVIKTQCPR
jgi:hypothetical protein